MNRESARVGRDAASIVTVGSFDGIHLGHEAILRYLIHRARSHGGQSTVVAFDPHPREVLTGVPMPLLTTVDERARLLESLGLDRFVVLEFTREFARLSAERFVRDILVSKVGLREIVVGHDHRFGRGREGDVPLLHRLGAELGFGVDVIPARTLGDRVVSSSAIRRLLTEAGDVRAARKMLGRRHSFSGVVVRGSGGGRTLGFPTANLRACDPRKVIPRRGVYAVLVRCGALVRSGMMNIGVRPTVEKEGLLQLEVHLFDFDGDLYGQTLEVVFVERLRDEIRFPSLDALRAQLARDEATSRETLRSEWNPGPVAPYSLS